MARSRNIKPGFFRNEVLAECSPMSRLLFIGLWCEADREGRLEDRPKKIRASVFPYDDCSIDDLIMELVRAGFLVRYTAGGNAYIQIQNFNKHQKPHHKEVASEIPSPEQADTHAQAKHGSSMTQARPKQSASCPTDSLLLIPDSLQKKGADAPTDDPQELIWKTGVSLLTRTGEVEATARKFLGQFAKGRETKLAEVIAHLALNPKLEPKAYIVAAMTRQSGAEEFLNG